MSTTRRTVLGSAIGFAAAITTVRAQGPSPEAPIAGERLTARTPDGLDLSVHAVGDPSQREIVLIHGLGQSRLSWTRQIESALARDFRIVSYDLRGHGDSDKPTAADTYADGARWADDLEAIMEAAGLRRPTLVGWSLGGLVIGHYLVRHGHDRVAGVNLVGAVTKLSPELLTPTALEFAKKLASPDLATRTDAIGAFLAVCFAVPPSEEEFRRMLVFNGMVPRAVQEGIVKIRSDGLDEAWAGASRLLVTYGEVDALTRPEMSARVLRLNPKAALSTYAGIGHTPFVEAPERFNRELAAFAAG